MERGHRYYKTTTESNLNWNLEKWQELLFVYVGNITSTQLISSWQLPTGYVGILLFNLNHNPVHWKEW